MSKVFSRGSETIYSTELIGIGKLGNTLMRSVIANCKYFAFVITAE